MALNLSWQEYDRNWQREFSDKILRLQTRLISAFLLIGILIGLAGYIGFSGLGKLSTAFDKEKDEHFPAYSSLSEIKATLPLIQLEPSEYINKPDIEHKEELEEAEEHIHEALLVYGKTGGAQKMSVMQQDVDELFDLSEEIISLNDEGATSESTQQVFDQLDEKLEFFADKLDAEKELIAEELDLSAQNLKNDIELTFNMTAILTASAVTIALVIGIYISRSVSSPISKLKEAADQIGKGNFDVSTKFWKADDEIGQLCSHFEKMKDQLKNKDKMQNEFMSIASHELRTPIQPILGYSELAAKGKIGTDEALKIIVREAKRLQRLANDILDVTRIESDQLKYTMESVDLNEVVSNVVETQKVSVSNDVTLQAKINETEGIHIFGDKTRMMQVLNNIIGNAMKFTRRGHISIQSDFLKEESKVLLTISDTGNGIPAEILPNLFGKFVTRNIRNENQQGSGLGLFISRAIVNAHNGHISARNNEDGIGATFTIILPVHFISDARREKLRKTEPSSLMAVKPN